MQFVQFCMDSFTSVRFSYWPRKELNTQRQKRQNLLILINSFRRGAIQI